MIRDSGRASNSDGPDWPDEAVAELVVQCLAEVEAEAVEWLWKGRIPKGKVAILEGESDVGKSTVTLDWARIVSTGSLWPVTIINGRILKSQRPPAGVVLVGVEDAIKDTVVPRLIANGADRQRIFTMTQPTDAWGEPEPFTIPKDVDRLRQAILQSRAELCVIDPITACLPEKIDHGVDAAIRRVLMCLVILAEESGCAIVLIRHFNKATGMKAKHRGGGSVAYAALVRSLLQATELAEPTKDGATHAIAVAIGNLAPKSESLGYTLETAPLNPELPIYEDEEMRVAIVRWCGTVDLNADQLAGSAGTDQRKNSPMKDAAMQALRDILANGPVRSNEAIDQAIAATGASKGTVQEASKVLGVLKTPVYKKKGGVDFWMWELPDQGQS